MQKKEKGGGAALPIKNKFLEEIWHKSKFGIPLISTNLPCGFLQLLLQQLHKIIH